MLKTLFEQMIEQYGNWNFYKIPRSDSPFTKYMFTPQGDTFMMIVELDMMYHEKELAVLLTLINRDIYKILSIKFY
jgi:hypothetical protein